MADEPRTRSRFDRDESERPSRSRFDRRSRSPTSREPEPRRTRSPVNRGTSDSPSSASASASAIVDKKAAAAAAAARINAQIQAKKGIQHVDVPPIRTAISPPVAKSPSATPSRGIGSDTYQQDGDYIKDIEINDLRNRYLLTKGHVQKKIKDDTGADVTTRGEYYPDKSLATPANPPLYLHVTSTTKEGLEAAVKEIEELLKQQLPNLVDERRFRRQDRPEVERDEHGRRKWPEEKIPIDLEPISGFNLRAQVVGRGGDNVKWIQNETQCRVQIKGRGSGFVDSVTGREGDEPMYLHVSGPLLDKVQEAKKLCEQLLDTVRREYNNFKERSRSDGYPPRTHDRERNPSYGYTSFGGATDVQSPAGAPNSNADYSQQWAAYYAQNPAAGAAAGTSADPYAAYGGYQAYMHMYNYYYGQSGAQHSPAPGTTSTAPPPPPPSDSAPPPPPPPPSASPPGTYNAVPPPPGM